MKVFEEEREIDTEIQNGEQMKALGVHWDPKVDTFHVSYENEPSEKLTLRQVMSESGQFSDPLHLALPVEMIGRMILQQSWRYSQRNDLDVELPEEFVKAWNKWKKDAGKVDQLKFSR